MIEFRDKLIPDYQGLRTKKSLNRDSGGYVKHPDRGPDALAGGASKPRAVSKSMAEANDIYGYGSTTTHA